MVVSAWKCRTMVHVSRENVHFLTAVISAMVTHTSLSLHQVGRAAPRADPRHGEQSDA